MKLSSEAWTAAIATFAGVWCVFLVALGPAVAIGAARAQRTGVTHPARTFRAR